MKKGSITVFCSLVLVSILMVLFSLLESARIAGIKMNAKLVSQAAVESVCAEYNRALLESYGLLFLDGAYGGTAFGEEQLENRFLFMCNQQANNIVSGLFGFRIDLLELGNPAIKSCEYQLATDWDAKAYYEMACEYEALKLGTDAIELISSRFQKGEELIENPLLSEKRLSEETTAELTQLLEEKKKSDSSTGEVFKAALLVEYLKKIQKEGILYLVLPDHEISNKEIAEPYSQRSVLVTGTLTEEEDTKTANRLIFSQYLLEKFSSYTVNTEQPVHALDYELEYLLTGKLTDRKNLEAAVQKLILFRQACDFAYLWTDTVKKEETLALATTLVGATGNPLIIGGVQSGIMFGWAYVESVLDVRALLQGKKISLVKNVQEWTSDLDSIQTLIEKNASAKEAKNGLDYNEHLRILLLGMQEKKYRVRSIDLIEKNIRQTENNENFCFDHCVSRIQYQTTWEIPIVFLRLFSENAQSTSADVNVTYSYK